jgi:hypothetical protein
MEGSKRCPGSAIAQTVSRKLPTAAARIRSHVKSCGICGGQSGTAEGILRVLSFPCQISFHQMLHTQLSSGAFTVGQLVADVPSGLSFTLPKDTTTKKSIGVYTHKATEICR